MSSIPFNIASNSSYTHFAPASLPAPVQQSANIISYDNCEHAWRYIGKISIAFRNVLTAATHFPRIVAVAGEDFAMKVKHINIHLRVFAIVSVPFSFFDLRSAAEKIRKSFDYEDVEGVALGSLSASIISTDIVDSVATFVNATFALAGFEPIQMLSYLNLPLPVALSSMGAVSRSIQISKAYNFQQLIKEKLLSNTTSKHEIKKSLREFLITQLSTEDGSTSLSKEIKVSDKKKAAILRFAPKAVTDEFEKMLAIVNHQKSVPLSKRQIVQIDKSLDIIQFQIKKKIVIDAMNIVANLINLFALGLFIVGTIGPIPNLLIATGFGIRIISVLYQDFKIQRAEIQSSN